MIREIENRRSIRISLTGIVAVGFADEAPVKRPRKPLEEIVEYR